MEKEVFNNLQQEAIYELFTSYLKKVEETINELNLRISRQTNLEAQIGDLETLISLQNWKNELENKFLETLQEEEEKEKERLDFAKESLNKISKSIEYMKPLLDNVLEKIQEKEKVLSCQKKETKGLKEEWRESFDKDLSQFNHEEIKEEIDTLRKEKLKIEELEKTKKDIEHMKNANSVSLTKNQKKISNLQKKINLTKTLQEKAENLLAVKKALLKK